MVDGVDRTFCDDKPGVYHTALELKRRNPRSKIEIKDRSTGKRIVMLEDSRTA